MNEKILQIITTYGLEAVVIALAVNVLVGVMKLPIKALAKKMEDGTNLTKFLVFLPVLTSAGLTLIYGYAQTGKWTVDEKSITLCLTAASLSLSFYAIFEKLIPSKRKILEKYEIEENKKLIETIKNIANADTAVLSEKPVEEVGATVVEECAEKEHFVPEVAQESNEMVVARKRIVLRGSKVEE